MWRVHDVNVHGWNLWCCQASSDYTLFCILKDCLFMIRLGLISAAHSSSGSFPETAAGN